MRTTIRLDDHPLAEARRVADANHAALAVESGSEWITTDGDYARFPGLRWRNPLRQDGPRAS